MTSLFKGQKSTAIDRFPRRTPRGLAVFAMRTLCDPLFRVFPRLNADARLKRLAFRGQQAFSGRALAYYPDIGIGRLEPAMGDADLKRYYESAYWDLERGHEDTNPRVESDARGEDQARYIRAHSALPAPLVSVEFGPGRAGLSCALHDETPGGVAHAVEAAGTWRDRLSESGRFQHVCAGLKELAVHDPQADLFAASHTMEHVSDLDDALADIDRLVAPGGHIFFEVPNCNEYYRRHEGIGLPHTFYYSPESVFKIADHMNWRALDVSCWGAPWSEPRTWGYVANPEGRFLRAVLRKPA